MLGQEGLKLLVGTPARLKVTPHKWVETAGTQRHLIKGRLTVPITLEGRTRDVDVLVVPSMSHTLILGIDFWEKMQLITDLRNKIWEFAPSQPKLASIDIAVGLTSESHLTEEEKSRLQELIEEQFKEQSETLGRAVGVEHVIDTGSAPPIKQRYYPMSPARLKTVYEELDNMLKLGVVAPSKSGW